MLLDATEGEKRNISRLFGSEEVRKLITSLRHRKNKSAVEVLDASYWMKGCSSLGRLRYAVLAEVGNRKKSDLCLIDIKEAVRAAPRGLQMRRCQGTMLSVW